jgi:hypothetical protein
MKQIQKFFMPELSLDITCSSSEYISLFASIFWQLSMMSARRLPMPSPVMALVGTRDT